MNVKNIIESMEPEEVEETLELIDMAGKATAAINALNRIVDELNRAASVELHGSEYIPGIKPSHYIHRILNGEKTEFLDLLKTGFAEVNIKSVDGHNVRYGVIRYNGDIGTNALVSLCRIQEPSKMYYYGNEETFIMTVLKNRRQNDKLFVKLGLGEMDSGYFDNDILLSLEDMIKMIKSE